MMSKPYFVDPAIKCPSPTPHGNAGSFFTFLAVSWPKMVRFSFRKKLLAAGNVLLMPIQLANDHGRLFGVLR